MVPSHWNQAWEVEVVALKMMEAAVAVEVEDQMRMALEVEAAAEVVQLRSVEQEPPSYLGAGGEEHCCGMAEEAVEEEG